ncbi:MAG: Rab family GTPase [Promethearchaeota archaeon]
MSFKFKVCLSGAKNVGKSSLMLRFIDDKFKEDIMDTIGVDFKRKKVKLDNNDVDLVIWDFAGEEKFRKLFPSYLNAAAAALVLFDITNMESFKDVDNWVNIIDENCEDCVTKILIGTKKDLEAQREVSVEEARAFHEKYNFSGDYMETSSKSGDHVQEAFELAVKETLTRKFNFCEECKNWISKDLKICRYCGCKMAV